MPLEPVPRTQVDAVCAACSGPLKVWLPIELWAPAGSIMPIIRMLPETLICCHCGAKNLVGAVVRVETTTEEIVRKPDATE